MECVCVERKTVRGRNKCSMVGVGRAGGACPADSGGVPAATPPASPEELAGQFPRFKITECLGRGGMGVVLDIPLGHKDAAFVRSHFDGMEVRVSDAPRANEIVVAVAVTTGGRPLPRVGGLQVSEIKGEDGLR